MTKTIKLDHLTKIEGHASLILKINKGKVERCDLSSIEGSRYFEGLVKGRLFHEAPEITSRICGICSCAHTLCSIFAMEHALNIQPSELTIQLRKLLNWGERIRSHTTHLYFLSLPDFLGYESALAMMPKYKEEIKQALKLMKLGNKMVSIIGGRDLHPVSAQIGGFLKYPTKESLLELQKLLKESRALAIKTIQIFSKVKYPKYERAISCFSIFNKKEYGMFSGVIRTHLKDYKKDNYQKYIEEYHEKDSTANFVVKEGRSYRVGALSRINNNLQLLHKDTKEYSRLLKLPSHNPFMNNFAQALEILHAIEECEQILENLELKEEKQKQAELINGHGIATIEVPRGTLWHEYKIKNKKITYCNIITPTAQNLRSMEEDIKEFLPSIINTSKENIINEVEKLIRAYDPCFSCSTHFLDIKWI